MADLKNYLSRNWFGDPKSNILSGIVVAFAMIPEAIASGIIAKATTIPERIFDFGSPNQFLDK